VSDVVNAACAPHEVNGAFVRFALDPWWVDAKAGHLEKGQWFTPWLDPHSITMIEGKRATYGDEELAAYVMTHGVRYVLQGDDDQIFRAIWHAQRFKHRGGY
jgi:hypothetical protein